MFGKLYQLGYVAGDLDAAMARLGELQNIRHFQVQVRDRPDSPVARSAKAYAGSAMIELIEPRAGVAPAMYADFLDPDPARPRLHHLGYLVETAAEFAAIGVWMAARGVSPAYTAQVPSVLSAVYYDTREAFGHYSEYVHLLAGGRDFYRDVPVNLS